MIYWNINGWTDNNSNIRLAAINSFNADIICLGETHLRDNHMINIDGYVPYDHRRKHIHINANKASGGVYFLVKNTVYTDYKIVELDKSVDGIFALKFTHKKSKYSFVVINTYLPPENSVWGRDATAFMSHLLSIVYTVSDCDAVYCVGDVNSRVGNKVDFVEHVDDLSKRHITDHVTNSHGETFIDFLLESKLCILNGRVCPENDDYTCVKTIGSSVVDYVCTFHDNINNCVYFKVHLVRKLFDNLGIYEPKIPDHSILEFDFIPHFINQLHNHDNPTETNNVESESNTTITQDPKIDRYFTRHKIRNMPVNFLQSDVARQALIECIQNIENAHAVQNEIDDMYKNVCNMYYNEMDVWFNVNHISNSGRKKFRNSSKPFWNEELTNMWKDLCYAENRYLSSPQHSRIRRHLLATFKTKQNNFDKHYSKAKRKFQRQKQINIERLNTENPREFWEELKKLGPRKSSKIPMQVYDESGHVTGDINKVKRRWESDFQTLYEGYNPDEFDRTFYEYAMREKDRLENINNNDNDLDINMNISENEVRKVISKAKNRKAIGIDNLPNEVLKNDVSCNLLTCLFQKIFVTHIIPSIWRLAIIKPIPKGSLTDPKLPLHYRGIALLSTVYKLYTSVLNNRIVSYLEENNMYAEEQNGFRQKRSCAEHIFTLSTILRNRKAENKSTYLAFLDAEKAFDRIDRELLLYKLQLNNITGHIYENIKSIYSDALCSVNVNNMLTDWFSSDSGLKQGDTLSPTMFNIYINDIVQEVKSTGKGIIIDGFNICVLIYADDIVLMSDSEDGLQEMLDKVYNWSQKWMVKFNAAKSNILHVRQPHIPKSNYTYKLGDSELCIVENYKYLGIIINEYMDYDKVAKTLADAANRALGAVINKYKSLNGLGYYTYTKLFNSGVCPILDYASEIWGFKNFTQIDAVQHKAMRIFLGVHRFAANAAVTGDMGWTQSAVRRKVNILRLWNRLLSMNVTRLPKMILNWDMKSKGNTWSKGVKSILCDINLANAFDNRNHVNLNRCWALLHEKACNNWSIETHRKPKLRTYVTFKNTFEIEPYVISFMNRKCRSYLAQFRAGILPLEIEIGRWQNKPLDMRICKLCDRNDVEDESHFILKCPFFFNERNSFMNHVRNNVPNIDHFGTTDMLKCFMSTENVCKFASTICDMMRKRNDKLFVH